METEDAALWRAVVADPHDDAPRLILADWLEEHGQPERAEFIRVQCELAWTDDPALRRREAELLAAHRDAFAGPLAGPHLRFRFERGFIVGFGHTGLFAPNRETWVTLFRFFPDGLVLSTQCRSIEDVPTSFDRENKYLLRGVYELDATDFPAAIRFECASPASRQSITFSGAFDGESVNPDGHARFSGYPMKRRFVHYNVDSFSSFPET
jgi:uncharacterized protein (TIGR02996 family)